MSTLITAIVAFALGYAACRWVHAPVAGDRYEAALVAFRRRHSRRITFTGDTAP